MAPGGTEKENTVISTVRAGTPEDGLRAGTLHTTETQLLLEVGQQPMHSGEGIALPLSSPALFPNQPGARKKGIPGDNDRGPRAQDG